MRVSIVILTQKLAVLTTIFDGGSSNCCSSLLIEGYVEDWMKIWNQKRSLLTKLSASCLKSYQLIS